MCIMSHQGTALVLQAAMPACARAAVLPPAARRSTRRCSLKCTLAVIQSRRENKKLRRAVQVLQEAEGRAEYRCRQAQARLAEIEAAELQLEAQVEAHSATKEELRQEIGQLTAQLDEIRCAAWRPQLPSRLPRRPLRLRCLPAPCVGSPLARHKGCFCWGCSKERDEKAQALGKAELDARRALSSVASYEKKSQVGCPPLPSPFVMRPAMHKAGLMTKLESHSRSPLRPSRDAVPGCRGAGCGAAAPPCRAGP
jgi:predicted Fe-S protein YdhL (DUF1289 family)